MGEGGEVLDQVVFAEFFLDETDLVSWQEVEASAFLFRSLASPPAHRSERASHALRRDGVHHSP